MAKRPQISAEEKRWRTEEDLRTLARAEEIRADRSRMTAVRQQAQQQVNSLQKVAGAPKTRKPASKPAARKTTTRRKK